MTLTLEIDPLSSIEEVVIAGVRHWRYADGTLLPIVAGGDGTEDDDESTDDETSEDDNDDDDDASDDDSDDGDDDDDDEDDVEKLKAALKKERQARRDAERKAKDAARKAKQKPKPKPKSDVKPDDDGGDHKPDAGTEKLRRANLITALMEEGYTGKRAKAVARLLDDVEYDDDDEVENLDDALEAAKDLYGKDLLRKGKPKPSRTDSADGDDGDKSKPSLTAEELAYAKEFDMSPEEYAAYKAGTPPKPPAKKDTKKDD